MENKNNKSSKSSIIGSIIAIIIILFMIFGGNNQLSELFALSANENENVNIESIDSLNNITITTGNDCISKIPNDNCLRVYCFDVGQGDSILVSNNGVNMLIDASTNEMGSTVVDYLNRLGINKIDYLIGTHPHEDHIGGLDNVIKNFDIGKIYMPRVTANTKTYEEVIDIIASKKLKVSTPKIGDKFSVGNAECEVMHIGQNTEDFNECSIVVRMEFDGVSYLFTGDANYNVENSRNWPETDILKVGHHGSSSSTTAKFLNQLKPKVALISCGEGNSYGHPTQKALDRLTKIGAKIYRTDTNQTILITELDS